MDSVIHYGFDMSGNRGAGIGRTLKLLRHLTQVGPLDARAAGKLVGMKPKSVIRNLRQLERSVPGVVKTAERNRHVFSFDPTAAFGGEPLLDEDRPRIATAIAVTLGSAFAKVFAKTQYQVDLRDLRQSVVEKLAGAWRQHFNQVSRKFVVVSGQEEVLDERAELLDDVIDAVLKQNVLRMRYRKFSGEEMDVDLRPYSLAVYDAHLYVIGQGSNEDAPHPYRFARILEAESTDTTFTYPEPTAYDPEALFRDSIGIWASGPEPCRIRVRFDPSWAVYVRHHRWHDSQRILKDDGNGVELELRVRPCAELEQWVLRFGELVEVLEPPELRAKIAGRLAKAAERYTALGQ